MSRITDLRIEWVEYNHDGFVVRGSNLLYKEDGKPSSLRVPWAATSAAEETQRLEKLIKRVGHR